MKEKLYKKEIWITVIFTVLLMLMGHFAQLFILFPSLKGGRFWGFPVEYIVPILMGWFGLAVVCWIQAVVCNRFDDEMEAFVKTQKPEQVTVKPGKG
jgi:hypothetical protein